MIQQLDYDAVDLDTDNLTLEEQCAAIWNATIRQGRAEKALRRQKPTPHLYDGDMQLQHVCGEELYSAEFSWISNDSGPGQTIHPFDSHAAQWIWDMQGRIDRGEKRNVHIITEYCGARWGGRLDNAVYRVTDDGDEQLIVTWLHDYENAKWYSVWSNPFLPAAFQFPRAFILAGPVPWILLLSLHLQFLREHNPIITIPDDPLDFGSYLEFLDMSQWHNVVKPLSFIDSMASGALWGIVSSRWSNWHDMAHIMLEDAELSVVPTRYLDGDPDPWPGANLRHGAIWWDIVDKSGTYIGTSHGGSLFDGLARTFAEFAEDFIDSTLNVIEDTDVPTEYLAKGNRLTRKELPYVVFRQGEETGIETSDIAISPAKGVQVNVGGHSMPGVNEAISASIQAGFDILGGIAQIGSLGGSVDALLKPLYEDTILAWWSVKSIERAQKSGWSRYFEYFQDGANKAYTIASLMVLRAGFWATKTTISCKIAIRDGAPWMVGDRGLGHFFLEDRIGFSLKNDPRKRIYMDRCRQLDLKWSPDNPYADWIATIGDDRILQDPAAKAWGKIEALVGAVKELGVY
ncbi:MAG TPA: hypothetical protein PLB92_00430 [Rhodoglobus sp.]|nr:hypothetical protein [Rhodoglobus sp.]